MLGTALYYPYVDVRDRQWLRSAILFWDRIQTIVPSSIPDPYHHADTRICYEEGYLEPLRCDLHREIIEQLGKKVIGLINRPDWLSTMLEGSDSRDPAVRALQRAENVARNVAGEFHHAGIYPEKMAPKLRDQLVRLGLAQVRPRGASGDYLSISHLHPDKLSPELKHLLGYRADYDGDWFVVDSRFAKAYMAALAGMLAKERNLSPLTTSEESFGLSLRFVVDEEAGKPRGSDDARGRLLTLVMKGLRVDPDTPINRLLAFRRSRELQLAELSAAFDELRSEIEQCEHGVLEGAARVFESKIQPELRKLKRELSGQTIQSVWTGFYQAAIFSAAGGSALVKLADMAPATALGVGAFLTATNVAVNSYVTRDRTRAISPYTYLLDIERRFTQPAYMN